MLQHSQVQKILCFPGVRVSQVHWKSNLVPEQLIVSLSTAHTIHPSLSNLSATSRLDIHPGSFGPLNLVELTPRAPTTYFYSRNHV